MPALTHKAAEALRGALSATRQGFQLDFFPWLKVFPKWRRVYDSCVRLNSTRQHIWDAYVAPAQARSIPVNTKHLYDICTMLDQRRWSDVVQMSYKCFVFAGIARCPNSPHTVRNHRTKSPIGVRNHQAQNGRGPKSPAVDSTIVKK